MKLLLNKKIGIDINKGLNIFLSNDEKCRNIFLSSFSLWFKTGINSLEDSSFEVMKDQDTQKKTQFELVTISPGIEDYLKARSTQTLISNQLHDFINLNDNISSIVTDINKKLKELVNIININTNDEHNYRFDIDENIQKEIIKLINYNFINEQELEHDIFESKKILVDLMIATSKKKELIIFIPYLSLALTSIEQRKMLDYLRSKDAYIIVYDDNFDLIRHFDPNDQIQYFYNQNIIISINELYEEISLIDANTTDIRGDIAVICANYNKNSINNYELINEYLTNKFML